MSAKLSNPASATLATASTTSEGGFSAIVNAIGTKGLLLALSLVFLWFGGMKFTAYEAGAIEGLVANSPFVAFLLDIFGTQGTSNLIGTIELGIAALLALGLFNPKLGVAGAIGAAITFVLTFSFFFTTPGVFEPTVGGLGISVLPGQFLLKDIVLLVASIAALNNSLKAIR